MSLNVKLVVVGGDVKTTELMLHLPATIGRGRGQSVVLPHPLVSRQHCELFESEGHLVVRDLGSLNGTFINNQKIEESPLPPGELLTVGTVTFRAVYEAEATEGSIETVKKPAPNDKTIPATKAPTIRAASKQPAPAAASDSAVLEFNFTDSDSDRSDSSGKPATSAQHPTERLKQTVVEDNRQTKPAAKNTKSLSENRPQQGGQAHFAPSTAQNEPVPGGSRIGTKPPSKQPPPDDDELDARLPGDEEEEPAATNSSDDDLNDFLKNLK